MDPIGKHIAPKFMRQAAKMRAMTRRVRMALPTRFLNDAEVIHIGQNSITLSASSPAVAHQLRYHLPKIQRQMGGQWEIRVRILPERGPVERPRSPRQGPSPISGETRQRLLQAAEQIPDPELKEAMQRLALHGPEK